MRLFKKNKSPTHHPVRSAEQLPAFAPHPDPVDDRRYSQFEYQAPSQSHSNSTPSQSLSRSQSQRQSKSLRDRPTVNVVPEERHDKGLSVRPSSGIVERSISVRGKPISNPISQPVSPRVSHPETLNETDEFLPPQHSFSENPSPVTAPQSFEPRSASLAYQQHQQPQQNTRGPRPSHPAHTENPERSQLKPVKPPLYTQPLARANDRPSPTDIPESPFLETNQGFTLQDPVMTTRPPSRTLEPLSPVQTRYPDAMQSQAQAQSPFQPDNKSADSPQRDPSRRGSVSNMPENGRNTPTTHRREDSGDADLRALIQKHDELPKYSKVKRYYFEKDAQVQHLQNTVAHQRMAVSRTVLDDNEYTNRFQRLDGAIKDLAFSVRKDWRAVPSWLNGMVSDEALATVTKEMTPVGRAIISRWLVEEVFQRYFHPALESAFSRQLKSIEMNLRRQRPNSDEERENASARLSYWRRTTFDGLSDSLVGPEADERRGELVEQLIMDLAGFLGSQLHDRAHPGLEAGVRMIIENSTNIIEKIPLEARDVCVDYFPPGVSFADQYMKVEGQLPALSHPPSAETDDESEEPSTAIENPSPAQAKSRKSVFGALMGRKPATSDIRPAAGEKEPESSPPRIRYSAFLAVEVRGKGPATVLIKSPVWLVE
ncbi:unnamed protein product [Penicillium salamii]|uniref:Uncharacterized protein n=1 Tax=Penicillium salamii TaxID=1612424 RepID=A0A9W4JG16_9EURO|nr:unnamed protein product [Penicillium salamii]CAG8202659.1 unnamed protein product [Penicillium salamii]CAG8364288.1 unnamed protein product [Penicillium salamii]CAG8394665.1 unnamed protein product [Penicillium salamii]CAG8394867.1 unnamed protein product [Penicillium salamii]